MRNSSTKTFCLAAVFYAFTFAALIAGAEMTARIRGYTPFQAETLDLREPVMARPDARLGWTSKPGLYVSPPYEPGGNAIRYHFLEDGSRAVSENSTPGNYDLIFTGCSFTLGWAISDEETFAWKIQNEFPELKIGNFGAAGYGTYQTLLLIRKIFERGEKPAAVIYGFLPFHEPRNAASASWLRQLAQLTQRKNFAVPYCSLDAKRNLIEHSPRQWPSIPLQERFAFPQMLIEIYYKIAGHESEAWKNKREITQKLLLKMDKLAKRNGSKLIVALLAGEKEDLAPYSEFLKKHGIASLDASFEMTEEKNHVPVDGHPNALTHSIWADKISAFLKKSLRK